MEKIFGAVIVLGIILGILAMADKIEDSRAQRIRAEVALVNANANAREGRILFMIIGGSIFSLFALVILAICIFSFNGRSTVIREIHHHHIRETHTNEKQVVVYLNSGSRRDFYKALETSAKKPTYIEG